MPAYVFETLADKAKRANVNLSIAEPQSLDWFRNAARTATANPNTMLSAYRDKIKNVPKLGNMYLFAYDPKTKDKLPFYDTFPLVIPFASARMRGFAGDANGFMGLNLHYLPLYYRAYLMNAIYENHLNNKKLDETTRFRLNYQILQRVAKLRFFQPCVKRYNFDYLRSRFLEISPDEWDMALFLNLARFQKASQRTVWNDSLSKI